MTIFKLLELSPSQLNIAILICIAGMLVASLLMMSQLLLYGRKLVTTFLLSVVFLLGYWVWASASLSINSRAGIFVIKDFSFSWFALVPLVLGVLVVIRVPKYRFESVPIVLSLIFVLPVLTTRTSVWSEVAAVIFLIVWLSLLLHVEANKILVELSRFSIKSAFDHFPQGLLFANTRGRTKLINETMERLLEDLGIEGFDSFNQIIEQLQKLANSSDVVSKDPLQLRITDSEGKIWLFTVTVLRNKQKEWIQLLASDITEDMVLSQKLSKQIEVLQERQTRIVAMTKRLDEALGKRLVLTVRSQIHDALAQRISFVHRFLEDGVSDVKQLRQLQKLLVDLPRDLEIDPKRIPQAWLATMGESAEATGIDLKVSGVLPESAEHSQIFLQVIREAITNVLLHTSAREIDVTLWADAESYLLKVSNPGECAGEVIYGQGLFGLQNRLAAAGGKLCVEAAPEFTLTAILPKKTRNTGGSVGESSWSDTPGGGNLFLNRLFTDFICCRYHFHPFGCVLLSGLVPV